MFMKERRPIFYDAERVRWRRTRRVLEISGALLTLLLAYFFKVRPVAAIAAVKQPVIYRLYHVRCPKCFIF